MRGLGRVADGMAWLGPIFVLGGLLAAFWGGIWLSYIRDCFRNDSLYWAYCTSENERHVLWGALSLGGGILLILGGVALFVPWVRDRMAIATLRRVWRPRQETWKQLFGAGHLRPEEFLPLAESAELLLSRRQASWLARYTSRVARGMALAFLVAGTVAILIPTLPTGTTEHCQTSACQAVLLGSGAFGLVLLAVGIPLFVAGIGAGAMARRKVREALGALSSGEARVLAAANERELGANRRKPRRKEPATTQG